MEELKDTFSLAILFAMGGGLISSIYVTAGQAKYSNNIKFLLILLSVILSATLADYLFEPKPWLYAGVGIFTGIAGAALLDAFKTIAPKLASRILHAAGDAAVSAVEHFNKKKKGDGNE